MNNLVDIYEQISARDMEYLEKAAAEKVAAEEQDAAGRIMARGFADELQKIAAPPLGAQHQRVGNALSAIGGDVNGANPYAGLPGSPAAPKAQSATIKANPYNTSALRTPAASGAGRSLADRTPLIPGSGGGMAAGAAPTFGSGEKSQPVAATTIPAGGFRTPNSPAASGANRQLANRTPLIPASYTPTALANR